nr:atherin-like [Manis javanica]
MGKFSDKAAADWLTEEEDTEMRLSVIGGATEARTETPRTHARTPGLGPRLRGTARAASSPPALGEERGRQDGGREGGAPPNRPRRARPPRCRPLAASPPPAAPSRVPAPRRSPLSPAAAAAPTGPDVTRKDDGRRSGREPAPGELRGWAGWGGAAGTWRPGRLAGPGASPWGRARVLPTAARPERRAFPAVCRRAHRAALAPASARAAGPPPQRAPTPRPRPLLPAQPERENGARFASGSDARPHLHAGAASQWGESVHGTPGQCPTGPLGPLSKAGLEALGKE